MDEQQQWYVTIAGNAVGPVSTDLVLRGIRHKKIATGAYVCVVGASEWLALTDVPEFHGALKENGLLPPAITEGQPLDGAGAEHLADSNRTSGRSSFEEDDETETTSQFSSRRLMDSALAPETPDAASSIPLDDQSEVTRVALLTSQPGSDAAAPGSADGRSDDSSIHTTDIVVASAPAFMQEQADTEHALPPSQPRNGKHAAALDGQTHGIEVDIDVQIAVDEPKTPGIDWNHGFSDYFLVDADVTLPNEQLLLRSLTTTPHDTFLHDEAMWNLALCLAFGSNAVASVAADVFFDVVTAHAQHERIEWMARTLLSRGFMPSGIPHAAGNQGIGRLRQACPEDLRMQLESQLGI